MKRAILGALVLAGLASHAAPASAQYYGGGRYYQEQEEYEYRPRPRRPPPGYGYYGGGNPYGGGYGGGYRQRVGSVCVTSRGNCSAGRAAPVNTPCGCFIPGFGRKRGAIGF